MAFHVVHDEQQRVPDANEAARACQLPGLRNARPIHVGSVAALVVPNQEAQRAPFDPCMAARNARIAESDLRLPPSAEHGRFRSRPNTRGFLAVDGMDEHQSGASGGTRADNGPVGAVRCRARHRYRSLCFISCHWHIPNISSSSDLRFRPSRSQSALLAR